MTELRTLFFKYAGSRPRVGVYPCYPDRIESTEYFSAEWTFNGRQDQHRIGYYFLRTLRGDPTTALIFQSGRHYTIQVQVD